MTRWWFQVFFIFTPIYFGRITNQIRNEPWEESAWMFFRLFFHATVYHTYDYVLAARDFKRSRKFLSPSLCACIFKYLKLCPHEGYQNSVSPKCPWPLGQLPVMDSWSLYGGIQRMFILVCHSSWISILGYLTIHLIFFGIFTWKITCYCWWKKSQTTTWDVKFLVNTGEKLPTSTG